MKFFLGILIQLTNFILSIDNIYDYQKQASKSNGSKAEMDLLKSKMIADGYIELKNDCHKPLDLAIKIANK